MPPTVSVQRDVRVKKRGRSGDPPRFVFLQLPLSRQGVLRATGGAAAFSFRTPTMFMESKMLASRR